MSLLNENFLRTFAHELRTPLTNMRMAVEMIQRISQMLRLNRLHSPTSADTLLLWDKLERYVEILQAEWKEECRLIGDLQEFQTAEVGNQSLPLTDVQLQVWLPDVIFRFMEQSEYEHRLSYSIPAGCIAIVVILPTLERVVLELIRAICIITPENDEIRITVEQKDAQTKITVQHLESGSPELRQRWQGLELRLALAKKLAIALRGAIELDQSCEQTKVILTLPL
jgi:signal transduction histidine kinase